MKLEQIEHGAVLVMIFTTHTVNNQGCGHNNDNGPAGEMRASLKTCV
jgi:hypothetical protein